MSALHAADREHLRQLAADLGGAVAFDSPLDRLTTWRIGGPAEALLQPTTRATLTTAVTLARQAGWPVHVLGNGSNLLVPDAGVPGLVIHLANHLAERRFDGDEVWAEAGAFLPKLAREAAGCGLSGLECVVGVPGTLGGGCVMNAGVPAGTLGDVLVDIEAMAPGGEVVTLAADDLALGHRDSRLQHEPWLVLAARLRLTPDEPEAIKARLDEHLAYRKRTQPLSDHTCGSVFRRPALPADGDLPPHPGWLLEQAGCKGLRRGDAVVAELHANWILNDGNARAADVLALMDEMQQRVRDRFGVELVREVIVWD